ncbi:MAG: SDR family oxidoreductase [Alphaproteobacteria bacterium]|nr:SDR family oxidoreductase [Alphaproteobacteria bacterium]
MSETVVVTGASAGVGRATAHAFARREARIGLVARGTQGLQAAAAEVEQQGGKALTLPLDMADPDAVEAAAERVENHFGPIDIWVNCAMATIFAPFHRISPEEYRRATEVTYLGFVYGTMAALKRMRARNRGTIVQVGSALSYRAVPLQSVYCGSKFAIRGFTDSLRTELIHDGVSVNLVMVQMPALNTPQFNWARNKMSRRPRPIAPIFQPEVAADAIVYAAHSRRREVWVARSSVKAIVGNKFFPGLLDRYLAKTGYSGQLTQEAAEAGQPDNLFDPVPGDPQTHGRFDDEATTVSPQLWANEHRGTLLTLGLPLAALIAAMVIGVKPAAQQNSSR